MNKTKRNLIIAAAILNLVTVSIDLVLSILTIVFKDRFEAAIQALGYVPFVQYTGNIVVSVLMFLAGLVGSILLLFSIRQKGKYFQSNHGFFIAGFIIVVIAGGWLSWILLFISLFVSDVVIINAPKDVKKEESQQQKEYDEKKKQIDELKKMRDEGIISEEEYKQKLFELL